MSVIHKQDDDKLQVEFYADVKGIAPGQSAVFMKAMMLWEEA